MSNILQGIIQDVTSGVTKVGDSMEDMYEAIVRFLSITIPGAIEGAYNWLVQTFEWVEFFGILVGVTVIIGVGLGCYYVINHREQLTAELMAVTQMAAKAAPMMM